MFKVCLVLILFASVHSESQKSNLLGQVRTPRTPPCDGQKCLAEATTDSTGGVNVPAMPDVNDNNIDELERPPRPTVDEVDVVRGNEIPLLDKGAPGPVEEQPSNVLMSHASDESIFNKTEVLAALIAGGAVGLMFAVLLILLLIYRMKKKDEGSYALGNKPIYKKAPTTEIYA
ncbi:hypothetical protein CRUP_014085 [Coryphaenoides rupestris]|nr:hypothetical protein CRUP_014085 [Coryphaenoides rupestris]